MNTLISAQLPLKNLKRKYKVLFCKTNYYYGKKNTCSRNWVMLPKIHDLLDGTVKNTVSLTMLPSVFRELSRTLFRVSRVVVGLFVHIASSEAAVAAAQQWQRQLQQ